MEALGNKTQEEIKIKRDEIVHAEKHLVINKNELDMLQQAIAEAINPEQDWNLALENTLSQITKEIQDMFGAYYFMDLKGQQQLFFLLTKGFGIAKIQEIKTREELEEKDENDYYNSVDKYFSEKELAQND